MKCEVKWSGEVKCEVGSVKWAVWSVKCRVWAGAREV